ncbi:MAG: RNA-binding protein [Fibrobacterales bacterium]
MKILIRGLSPKTTEEALQKMFEEFGPVQYCNLVLDQETQKSKGFAFVEIPKVGEAKYAIKQMNGKEIDGNKVRVKRAAPNPTDAPKDIAESDAEIVQGTFGFHKKK